MEENITGCKDKYTLTYFNARGGGEIVRLVFAAAEVPFTDNRIEKEDWLKLKPNMPMKNVPVLTVCHGNKSTTYCQSGAIARYLSKKFGLYGSTDEENFLIEEMYDSVGDVRCLFVQRHFSDDLKVKSQLLDKLTSTSIPNLNGYFIDRKSDYGTDQFIIGQKLTLADLAMFGLVDGCVQLGMRSMFEPYPALLKHRDGILQIPAISNWVNTRPKTDV